MVSTILAFLFNKTKRYYAMDVFSFIWLHPLTTGNTWSELYFYVRASPYLWFITLNTWWLYSAIGGCERFLHVVHNFLVSLCAPSVVDTCDHKKECIHWERSQGEFIYRTAWTFVALCTYCIFWTLFSKYTLKQLFSFSIETYLTVSAVLHCVYK